MIVYVDIIILINIFIDLLLIISLSIILKRNPKTYRIILSSLIGGISTILLFYINNNLLLLIYKLITSIIMILISFGYKNYSYFKDNLLYLYILSIILGGTLYLINNSVTLKNIGLTYQNTGLKINIIVLILFCPIILYKYVKKEMKYKNKYSNYYNVDIYYNDKKISGTGFLDTGNNLKDPYFHKPITIVNKDIIKEKVNTFLVPYNTVNNKNLLEVFVSKKIVINNHTTKKALIGLSDINFNGVKIILNKETI